MKRTNSFLIMWTGIAIFCCLLINLKPAEARGESPADESSAFQSPRTGSLWSWLKGKFSSTTLTPIVIENPMKWRPEQSIGISSPRVSRPNSRQNANSRTDPLVLCTWNIFRFGPAKFSVPDLLIQAGLNVTRMDIIVDVRCRRICSAFTCQFRRKTNLP